MSIRVKKFDPCQMKESRIIYLIGRRHSGKSVLMKALLSSMPKPDYVIAMAPTQSSIETFREFLPDSCIYDHYDQERVERLINLQRELISNGKERRCVILMDDCLYQSHVLKSTAMKNLHFNGRHLKIGMICCAQYMMSLPPEMRTNVDYLFVMRDPVLTNRQKLYKGFFGVFDTFQEFDNVMSTVTQNYGALCLDGTVPSTNFADCVQWYRANTDIHAFKLCRSVYWKLSDKCGRSLEEIRRAQAKQFAMEEAQAQATRIAAQKSSKVVVVQTEDEHGQIVSSSA